MFCNETSFFPLQAAFPAYFFYFETLNEWKKNLNDFEIIFKVKLSASYRSQSSDIIYSISFDCKNFYIVVSNTIEFSPFLRKTNINIFFGIGKHFLSFSSRLNVGEKCENFLFSGKSQILLLSKKKCNHFLTFTFLYPPLSFITFCSLLSSALSVFHTQYTVVFI